MAPLPAGVWPGSSKLFDRFRQYYGKDAEPHPPPISQRTAFACAILYTVFYIAPFYLSPTLRNTAQQSRDSPTVIRARVRAVVLTCLACTVITVYLLAIPGHGTPQDVLRLVGIYPVDVLDIAKVLGLVMVLFTCSLYESVIVDGDWRGWGPRAFKAYVFDSWIGYRNLIVAPVSEELVFRALLVPLFLLAQTSPVRIVFLTPLVFGLAHVHHLAQFVQTRTPKDRRFPPAGVWLAGVATSLFQFAYTSLFGFFAAFVFLRTGNLWAVILAHSFCNHMGIPRLWGRVGQYEFWAPAAAPTHTPTEAGSAQSASKKDDDSPVPGSLVKVGNSPMQDEHDESKAGGLLSHLPKQLGVAWTVVYYALVPVGMYGFYRLLWPLTESEYALARF